MGGQPAHDTDKSFFQWFVHSQVAGSVVLLAATATALIWANSPWSDGYFGLVDKYVGVSWGDQTFRMSLGHWVADGLMVIWGGNGPGLLNVIDAGGLYDSGFAYAEDIADAILYVITRPPHVNINDMLIMPTSQAAVHKLVRKN